MEESKWHDNFQSLLDVIACTQPNLQNQPMLLCLYRLVPRHTETSPHLLQGLDRRQLASHFEGRALASGGFWGARAISASAFYIFSFCFSFPHFWRDIRSGAARLMRCRSQAERESNEDEGRIPPLKAPVFQRASARWEQSRSRLSRGINRSEKPREHPQLLPLSPSE